MMFRQIAHELRLAHSTFRAKLADSGYRIVVQRYLKKITPIEALRREDSTPAIRIQE